MTLSCDGFEDVLADAMYEIALRRLANGKGSPELYHEAVLERSQLAAGQQQQDLEYLLELLDEKDEIMRDICAGNRKRVRKLNGTNAETRNASQKQAAEDQETLKIVNLSRKDLRTENQKLRDDIRDLKKELGKEGKTRIPVENLATEELRKTNGDLQTEIEGLQEGMDKTAVVLKEMDSLESAAKIPKEEKDNLVENVWEAQSKLRAKAVELTDIKRRCEDLTTRTISAEDMIHYETVSGNFEERPDSLRSFNSKLKANNDRPVAENQG